MDPLLVETVDGAPLELDKARRLSKRVFLAGFACLPWLWAANVWMFWPAYRHQRGSGDPVLKAYLQRSAWCFGGWLCLFVPWVLAFSLAGRDLLGSAVYDRLDTYQIDMAGLGLGF